MADDDKQTEDPGQLTADPAARPDEGLASWGKVVQSALMAVNGVELSGTQGSSVYFSFRGQSFAVHIQRTS